MRAISLWQPWAQWVILGWKTVETRWHERFKCLVDQRIGIHAAQKWDKDWPLSLPYLTDEKVKLTETMRFDRKYKGGNLLGSVFVQEHRLVTPGDSQAAMVTIKRSDGPRFGLVLRDPHPLHMPILCSGSQGIFTIPL